MRSAQGRFMNSSNKASLCTALLVGCNRRGAVTIDFAVARSLASKRIRSTNVLNARAKRGGQPMNKPTLGVSRRRVLHTLGAFAGAAPFLVSRAYAAWPDRPVKIIVPFGPGGPVDVIARLLQPFLTEELKGN